MYSFRVALWGNPIYYCVSRADPALISRLEQLTLSGQAPEAGPELSFLRSFSRLTLLELGAFLLEIGLLTYFLASRTLGWLAGLLLLKNAVMVVLSLCVARRCGTGGIFGSLRDLPGWLVWTDRVSFLATGIGGLLFFLKLNNLLP